MIALAVSLNGKRVCVAGADDLCVLTTSISAVGKLGKETVPARLDDTGGEIYYSVGGLTARPDPKRDVHLSWKSVARLKVGDVIQVRIVESDTPDRPRSRRKAKPRTAKQTVQRTGASRAARTNSRTSSAPDPRR